MAPRPRRNRHLGAPLDPAEVDVETARGVVDTALAAHPDGVALERAEVRELLGAYGIDVWPAIPVTTLREAQSAGRKLGWDVVLKATADGLRERPDLAHVWRNVASAAEMRTAWQQLTLLLNEPAVADFVVQRMSPPGVAVSIRSVEDPLFGPVVSFGMSGPIIELLNDRAFRIPPLGERDVTSMVREVKSSPMLFGYRGSEAVDVPEIERLIGRVAQLQNDLPQLSSVDLSLVLVGTGGSSVLTAQVSVAPVADPRADFVRRMSDHSEIDTVPQ